MRVGQNDVRRLLRDHVDGAQNEEARNARENRGIDDAQILRVMHAKVGPTTLPVSGEPTQVPAWYPQAFAGELASSASSTMWSLDLLCHIAPPRSGRVTRRTNRMPSTTPFASASLPIRG